MLNQSYTNIDGSHPNKGIQVMFPTLIENILLFSKTVLSLECVVMPVPIAVIFLDLFERNHCFTKIVIN